MIRICSLREKPPTLLPMVHSSGTTQFQVSLSWTIHNVYYRWSSVFYVDCRPQQIWMLARHGARYPTAETTTKLLELTNLRDQILNNHENRKGELKSSYNWWNWCNCLFSWVKEGRLCNEDLQNLRRWSPNMNMTTEAKRVTPEGLEESKLLARRMQSAFPELLQPPLSDINAQNYVVIISYLLFIY